MITSEHVVKYEEDIRLETVSTDIENANAGALETNGIYHQSKYNVKIIRDLHDDSFKIFIEDIIQRDIGQKHFVQINNKETANSENSLRASKTTVINGKKYFTIDSKQMGLIKFKDVDKMVIGYVRFDNICAAYQLNFIHTTKKTPAMTISQSEIAEFKVFKEINIQLRSNYLSRVNYVSKDNKKDADFTVRYAHAFYKPSQKDRYSPVQELGSIYTTTDDSDGFISGSRDEYREDPPKLITTSLKKTSLNDVIYKKRKDQSVLVVETEDGRISATYSDSLFFRGRTSYDYEKKKTILGGTESPVLGEIIPYSFEGQYHWEQKISPFGILKNFQIDTYKNFDHAVLNESNGDIRMSISIDEENGIKPNFVIGENDIHRIKSLKGLYDLRILESMGTHNE